MQNNDINDMLDHPVGPLRTPTGSWNVPADIKRNSAQPSAEVPYAPTLLAARRLDFSKTPLLEPPTHGELPPLSAKIRPASTWADFFQAQIDNEVEIKPVMELKK